MIYTAFILGAALPYFGTRTHNLKPKALHIYTTKKEQIFIVRFLPLMCA